MFGNYYVTLHGMEKISRREWLARVGSFTLGSVFLSSCDSNVTRGIGTDMTATSENESILLEKVNCRRCYACMPCRYGVDIPANFIFLNSALTEGEIPATSESPDFYSKGLDFLARYETVLTDGAQAQHCIDCGECSQICRHGVNISAELEKITALTDMLRNYRAKE